MVGAAMKSGNLDRRQEHVVDRREHLDRAQRISTKREEIVVRAHFVDAQELSPDLRYD